MSEGRATFWMVYGLHQRAPVYRHKTEASAIEEAKRLARQNPEVEFFVLESIRHVVKREVDVTPMQRGERDAHDAYDYHDDGIPF